MIFQNDFYSKYNYKYLKTSLSFEFNIVYTLKDKNQLVICFDSLTKVRNFFTHYINNTDTTT